MSAADNAAAERRIALSYAPAGARDGLAALLALDDRLAAILRTTREPLIGRMRLAWWREALAALATRPSPGEPVLAALADEVSGGAMSAVALAALVEGWEALLAEPLGREAVAAHAADRGGGLFAAAAGLLGIEDARVAAAGEGWALADVARHLTDPALAMQAADDARTRLASALAGRWPAPARPLGALAHLARLDLAADARPAGHPARAARLLWHRASGR